MKRIPVVAAVLFQAFILALPAYASSDNGSAPEPSPMNARLSDQPGTSSSVSGLPPEEVRGKAYDPSQLTMLPGNPKLTSEQGTQTAPVKQQTENNVSSKNAGVYSE